jgi:hypothetical protein
MPVISEVSIEVSTNATNSDSSIIPDAKVTLASTIPGPPLAFIVTP